MTTSRRARGSGGDDLSTRVALVAAATDVLREDGFVGATARAIAARAQVNSAAVFYYFGSVHELLLAALDASSGARLIRYREATDGVAQIPQLVEVFVDLNREDHEAGHVAVMAAMVGGASAIPGLGAAIAQRVEPWIELATDVISRVLRTNGLEGVVDARVAGRAVVALFLGGELLTQLVGSDEVSTDFAEELRRLAALAGPLLQLFGRQT